MQTPQWQWPVRVEQGMMGTYRIVDKRGLPVTAAGSVRQQGESMSTLPTWTPLPTHWPIADHTTMKRPTNSRAVRRRWKRFRAGDLAAWPWPLRCDNPGWGGWIENLEIPA